MMGNSYRNVILSYLILLGSKLEPHINLIPIWTRTLSENVQQTLQMMVNDTLNTSKKGTWIHRVWSMATDQKIMDKISKFTRDFSLDEQI